MQSQSIIDYVTQNFEGVVPKSSWGETSLFYNPDKALPNGVYFCTLKEKDGANDKASDLNREGVFRLSIGIGSELYQQHFGAKPKRPAKGEIIDTQHDFTALNILMPHPIYGWMSWAQIINPTEATFNRILPPLLTQAYANAVIKFNQKVKKSL